MRNLLAELPADLPEELVEVLAEDSRVRIERIVSTGHCSPEGDWYDQDRHEFVMVLKGSARLEFEGEPEVLEMAVGDSLVIAAHRRHRVAWTSPGEPTVWLAVFYGPDGEC